MTFSIIGTGNIAWFLGTRIVLARHHCVGVYGRNTEAVAKLATNLLCDKYGTINDVKDGAADVCFLAVSDTAIPEIAAKLAFKKTILVITAGAVDLERLETPAAEKALLWPVYSILKNSLPGHRNIPCGWEAATEKAKRYVLAMGHAITDELFEAKYEQRKWLHVSAVMSNNFITHLLAICEQICAENELPFDTLRPIIDQTFDRIKNGSPSALQTGPAIRKDENTIKEQLLLLQTHPHWGSIYEAMTASIQAVKER